jgi:transcriptional regulator with XRE-family HTH domain
LTTTSVKTQQIATSLDDKEYAHAFVDSEITTLLPFQIREMRKEREWSQTKLAEVTGQNQKTISDFENPNYARYSLSSLKRLAEAFDVALIVRFAPFSDLVDWASNLSPDKFRVPARTKDERLREQKSGGLSGATVFFAKVGASIEQPFATSQAVLTYTSGTNKSVATEIKAAYTNEENRVA